MKAKNTILVVTTFLALLIIISTSCTENQKARKFGGKEEIQLKPNEVLINVTWKESNMWVLTEDTLTHVKYFRENSNWGVFEGEIVIK